MFLLTIVVIYVHPVNTAHNKILPIMAKRKKAAIAKKEGSNAPPPLFLTPTFTPPNAVAIANEAASKSEKVKQQSLLSARHQQG